MNEKKSRDSKRGRAGFTLIEIMLVVVIIGLLAGLAIVNVPKFLGTGQKGKLAGDFSALGGALDAYYMDEGKYPSSLSALVSGDEPYFRGGKLPKDPWGGAYQYTAQKAHGYPYTIQTTSPEGEVFANWNMDEK